MSLKERLMEEFKTSMKEKDIVRKNTITMVRSAIKQIEVDNRVELNDEQVVEIIVKQVKQKKDAIEEFKKGNRNDLVEETEKEISILMTYLPEQLSEEEVRGLVASAIEETGATSSKDMGKVMPIVIQKTKGKADSKLVSQLVKELLSN